MNSGIKNGYYSLDGRRRAIKIFVRNPHILEHTSILNFANPLLYVIETQGFTS
jgi:hypothetical protein